MRLFKRAYKNNKFSFYFKSVCRWLIPGIFFRPQLTRKLESISLYDFDYIQRRVNYYNKLTRIRPLPSEAKQLSNLKLRPSHTVYYFDSYEYSRFFAPTLNANFVFGDVIHVPEQPSFVKSRPIDGDNEFSILLKLNKIRHFIYTSDWRDFQSKRNMLVGRAVVKADHRVRFYAKYFDHPMCNLAHVSNDGENRQWVKERLSIDDHLEYKFILCLEGNDVASNLKWVMSSKSLAVMPKPKYETWFMEGTLVGNHHYVQIKDDYSDLEERLHYYIKHPQEALAIVRNANEYVEQFKNNSREDLISLLVMEKYFCMTGQIPLRQHGLYSDDS